MGKFILILILAAAGVGVIHGASSQQGLTGAADQAAEAQRRVLARSAAKTGWQRAKQNLVGGFAAGTITGQNGDADYTVTTTLAGDEAIVVSEGRVPIPGRSALTRYTLTYRLRAVGWNVLPPFAEHALVVDGDLSMSGNGSIVSPGLPDDSVPVRVHANGNLHAGSGSTVVEGFGTFTTSSSGHLSNTFRPRSNPDGDPELAQADSIAVPRVVPSEILAAYGGATVTYPSTGTLYDIKLQDLVLPGGTRDNPVVYHVNGGAALVNVTFTGYAVFIAEDEVKLQATVRGTPSHPDGTNESALAVYTTGEVSMSGGSVAHAAIHTNGGLSYRGGVEIHGNLIVAGDFSNGGGATVHYVPPAPSLFFTWDDGDPALELLAFREQ